MGSVKDREIFPAVNMLETKFPTIYKRRQSLLCVNMKESKIPSIYKGGLPPLPCVNVWDFLPNGLMKKARISSNLVRNTIKLNLQQLKRMRK
ncbi:MAG: hypothetical protein KJ655_00340 [Candidatus Thermoplasmatota archaeon]|nr:hypothetical protein [Candidatus Thermoplasmatota archaeon]